VSRAGSAWVEPAFFVVFVVPSPKEKTCSRTGRQLDFLVFFRRMITVNMYDIGIVGAGPAGTTLARLLADRYRILLLDSGRQKCCGGILNLAAQKAFAQFDLAIPKHVLADPQPLAVTVMDWDNHLVRSYARQYVNIDRIAFDHWLLSLVPQTVDVRNNAVYQKSERNGDNLTLHFMENKEPKTAQVRWLVGADGAFSAVRREFFPTPTPKRYIAVQHWFEQNAVSVAPNFGIDVGTDYGGIFDSTLTDFYLWTIPKCGQLIVGGAFPLGTNQEFRGLCPRTPVSATMTMFKEKLESFGLRLGTPIKREAGQMLRPLRSSSVCFGDAKTILVGEAAGFISAATAEGFSSAFESAFHLAEAFRQSGFDPALYRRLLRNQRWKLWRHKYKIPLMFNPLLRKYVMLSRFAALHR